MVKLQGVLVDVMSHSSEAVFLQYTAVYMYILLTCLQINMSKTSISTIEFTLHYCHSCTRIFYT